MVNAILSNADPRSHSDLEIPHQWTLTSDEKPFLIQDSGTDSPERMLVFASEVRRTQLAQADTWHMDGTFVSASTLFKHVIDPSATWRISSELCLWISLQQITRAPMKSFCRQFWMAVVILDISQILPSS